MQKNKELGAQIKEGRKALKITQSELAEKTGTNQKTISSFEARSRGTITIAAKIAKVLNKDLIIYK